MSWNYRVLYDKVDKTYEIHGVYYDENGDPDSWSRDPIAPIGDTFPELIQIMDSFCEALQKPILQVSRDGKTLVLHSLGTK